MLKSTELFVSSVYKIDDNKVVNGDRAEAKSGRSISGLDMSRKELTKSKSRTISGLNCIKYLEDKEDVYPSRCPQRTGLIAEEIAIKVLIKYVNFAFSLDLASKLPMHTRINDYPIKLVIANRFIRLFKSPINALIIFDQKPNISLVLIIEAPKIFPTMSVIIAITVSMAMTSLAKIS